MNLSYKYRGFTMIEVIVSILILGIVSSLVVSVVNRTVLNYHNLSQRDKLSGSARIAIERIVREVRLALPNSLCTYNGVNCSSSSNKIYFLKTVDAGQYQYQTGTYTDPTKLKAPLPISPNSADHFDIISNGTTNVSPGDWVVVYNLNNTNIYNTASNRKKITSITTKDPDPATPNDDITVLNFNPAFSFQPNVLNINHRFQIVEDKVILFYLQNSNLYLGTTTDFSNPSMPTSSYLLLENVSAVNFSYSPGSQHRSGLLTIDLKVTIDNESVQLIHEAHVANVP